MIIIGRIKVKDIKKVSFELIKRYPDKFSSDFVKNKEFVNTLDLVEDKSVRNKISGYIAHKKKAQ